jgi:uncharacterized protein
LLLGALRGWMGFFGWFRRSPDKFLKLLTDQAAMTLAGMEALEEFANSRGDGDHAKRLYRIEKEADEVRRILIDELNRSFVTPFDREDIFALSRAIDDILDYGYTTLDEMVVLGVQPNPYLRRMVSLLREAAFEIHMATLRLKDHPNVASEHAMRAKALENAWRVSTARRLPPYSRGQPTSSISWKCSSCVRFIATSATRPTAATRRRMSLAI